MLYWHETFQPLGTSEHWHPVTVFKGLVWLRNWKSCVNGVTYAKFRASELVEK